MSQIKEECGIFGVFGDQEAVRKTFLGLHSLQHRGQESAGIASSDGEQIYCFTDMGQVNRVFRAGRGILERLDNPITIGHVRCSAADMMTQVDSQPFLGKYSQGQVAIAQNGNIINASLLRDEFEAYGHIFKSSSDTEIIVHLMAKPSHMTKSDPLGHVLNHLQGAYSLIFLFPNRIEAARDPYGIRPLCLGRTQNGAYCVASETCALDAIKAEYVRDVEPGEIITLDKDGLSSRFFVSPGTVTPGHCIFEHVYFAKQSSMIFGENVHDVRVRSGRQLAIEHPVDADLVMPVPDSGTSAAIGYANQSGIPFDMGFIRSHYVGRTFLSPLQDIRELGVQMKLAVVRSVVEGKRIIVIDDSIVRGTTTKGKINSLREAGTKEIHMRIACPPIKHPCFYGVDFPTHELLANRLDSIEEIRKFLGVDSLEYISLEGLLSCASLPPDHYCTACWSGEYKIPVSKVVNKFSMERHQMELSHVGKENISWQEIKTSKSPKHSEKDTIVTDTGEPFCGNEQVLYPVYYCTNRLPKYQGNRIVDFLNKRGDGLYYGYCQVLIPESHRIGSLGAPWWKRLLLKKDDPKRDDPLQINSMENFREEIYWSHIQDYFLSFNKENEKHALIFIHGYNVSFKESTLRAAQLGSDLRIPLTAYFSWPSHGTIEGYSADEATIDNVEEPLEEYLLKFAQQSGAQHIHLLAHSMGNRALLRAISKVAGQAENKSRIRFSQIFLAAPDVDRDLFLKLANAYKHVSQRTTLYASSKDNALIASGFLHKYVRAGILPPITVINGLDTIDASCIDFSRLGHGYYAEARPVIEDMVKLVFNNTDPRHRLLQPIDCSQGRYWRIQP